MRNLKNLTGCVILPIARIFRFIKMRIKQAFKLVDAYMRSGAVDTLEFETVELENVFALLVLGSFIGLPSPPLQVTLELMPEMEGHLLLMLRKVDTAAGPLSDLASILDLG